MTMLNGDDATKTPEAGLNSSQTDSTPPVDAAPADDGAFDPRAFEEQFGFPEGHLKDAKTVEDVLQAVAEFTDKTLIAGLDTSETGDTDPNPFVPPKPDDKPAKIDPPAGNESDDMKALRARLESLESKLQENELQHVRSQQAELQRRLATEIDSWASSKYGVGKNRNFKQTKAVKEVQSLVNTHVAGLLATGQTVPTIEVLARRVRAIDDETFKPSPKKAADAAPLGTPGTNRDTKGGANQPANIHQVLVNR